MESLVDVGLRNALLAVPLAVLVLILSLVVRRPALLHLLWVLVLLRLVMPPLWNVTVPRPIPAHASIENAPVLDGPRVLLSPAPAAAPPTDTTPMSIEDSKHLTDETSRWWQPGHEEATPVAAVPVGDAPVAAAPVEYVPQASSVGSVAAVVRSERLPSWRLVLGSLWLFGTGILSVLTCVRLGQFILALRDARPAPAAIQRLADDLAQHLGLRRSPQIVFVQARVSPMLWGMFGRPCLILPALLWARLDTDRRSALLAHELAHYRRGDHWVRWLELLAGLVFWWHPVVWLVRHRLREAEEQCCDAWVVWALPHLRRDYAMAIVDTVGYLSEGRSELPALASGVGQVRHLRRRVTMIMRDTTPRRLPRVALAALLGGGLAFASLAPTWGQDRPKDPPKPPAPPERRDGERRTERPDRPDRERPEARAEERGRDEMRAELEKARAEFERARMRLEELERRFGRGPGAGDRPREGGDRPPGAVERPREGGRPGEGDRPREGGDRPRFGGFGGAPAAGIERRMEMMEKQLQEIMRQLEEMRRGGRRGAGEGGDRPGFPGRPGAGRGAPELPGDDTRPRAPGEVPRPPDGPRPPTPPTPPRPGTR